ncbi:hypothetical protein L204_103959 [Cryptococcus depauperatus]|nr:hypothetical protein L204_03113 [Cryptococcus depauperatus CBS 7855]
MISPPYHFNIASCPSSSTSAEILYRGAIPAERNLAFVSRLGLKTIILLRKKALKSDEALSLWAKREGVSVVWIEAEEMGDEKLGIGKADVGQVLKLVLNPTLYPLYIADVDGKSHTTLVIACLRKLQGWHMESVINEICRFEPDHEDLPLALFVSTYLASPSSSSTTVTSPEPPFPLPAPPYPCWLWPSLPSRSQSKERESRDRSSSTNSAIHPSTPLPFPHPLLARKHPTMRLTFPSLQQPQSVPLSTMPPVTSSHTDLIRASSKRDKISVPPSVTSPEVPVPRERTKHVTQSDLGIGSPDEGVLSAAAQLMNAGLNGMASVLSAISPPPPKELERHHQNDQVRQQDEEENPIAKSSPAETSHEATTFPQGVERSPSSATTSIAPREDESQVEDEDEDEEDSEEDEDEDDDDEELQTTSQYISALDLAGY